MQQEGGRVVCKKLASQSEQLIGDYAHFLSLSLVHGQVPLTSLTILAHWLSSHHSSTMVWRQRHNNVSASGRRAARYVVAVTVVNRFDGRFTLDGAVSLSIVGRKTRPSQRPSVTIIELGALSFDKDVAFLLHELFMLLTTCSLLSDLSNLANEDLNKRNGNLQKQTLSLNILPLIN